MVKEKFTNMVVKTLPSPFKATLGAAVGGGELLLWRESTLIILPLFLQPFPNTASFPTKANAKREFQGKRGLCKSSRARVQMFLMELV